MIWNSTDRDSSFPNSTSYFRIRTIDKKMPRGNILKRVRDDPKQWRWSRNLYRNMEHCRQQRNRPWWEGNNRGVHCSRVKWSADDWRNDDALTWCTLAETAFEWLIIILTKLRWRRRLIWRRHSLWQHRNYIQVRCQAIKRPAPTCTHFGFTSVEALRLADSDLFVAHFNLRILWLWISH